MSRVETIFKEIKAGVYPKTKVDITQFYDTNTHGDVIPKPELFIQPREKDRDLGRIHNILHKVRVSGDTSGLEALCCVEYSDGSLKIDNGSHTAEVVFHLYLEGILPKDFDAFKVSYDKDLDGLNSEAYRLGNKLNMQDKEKADVATEDIKKEYHQIMTERVENGLEAKPDADTDNDFIKTYEKYGVTQATLGQWASYHKDGTRGNTSGMKTYEDGELQDLKRALENLEIYKDHVVIFPRQIVSWDGEAIAMAISTMTTNLNRKCLIPFRCKDKVQKNFWEKQNTKGEFVNQIKIRKKYDEMRDFLRLEAFDLTMLRY
tara:strand:+ start:118 stop:1071 length:954 start_codon:yes stop_codon:yes gene_type:complete